jgi:[acyl-carrier-protein] S-malonyltransferase
MKILESIITADEAEGICQIANDNIEGQIVISGHVAKLDIISSSLKELGYRTIPLKVSAPFHCDLMKPAEIRMIEALSNVTLQKPVVPLIANVSATAVSEAHLIKEGLIKQICARVRWRETLDKLAELGVEQLVEIGSGKILTSMLRKTSHNFKTFNISNIFEFEDFMKSI